MNRKYEKKEEKRCCEEKATGAKKNVFVLYIKHRIRRGY